MTIHSTKTGADLYHCTMRQKCFNNFPSVAKCQRMRQRVMHYEGEKGFMSKCVRLRLAPSRYLHVFRSLSSRSYLVQSRPYLFGFGCISFKAWGTSSYSGNIFNARPFFYGRKENRKQERAREAVRRKKKRVGSKLCWRVMQRGISPT